LTALKRGCTDWKFNCREIQPVRAFWPSGVRILTDLHAYDDNDDRWIHTLQMKQNLVTLYNSSVSNTHREYKHAYVDDVRARPGKNAIRAQQVNRLQRNAI
jgi:hypothetical protein